MEEDEERRELLQKIVDLLLEGGCFRARISSLLPFDKLTGGLAWCIIASNADIDFDFDLLFFDDEATLGEKIMVGEAIEAALQSMACPYPLQAHQIQGLDYQAVYPVVQWLVKKVLAMREELGDELRRFSHLQFEKYYQLPEEAAAKQALQERLIGLSGISILQQPKRLYRQSKNNAIQRAPADCIHSTLLEYGLETNRSGKKEENSGGRTGFLFSNIKTSDSAFSEADDALVSTSRVCQLFNLCKEEIQHAFANYSFTCEDHGTWKQKAAILLREIEKQEISIEQYKENLSQAKNALEILKQNMKEQDQKNGRVKTDVNHLKENVHKEGATSIVERLLSLLHDLKSLEKDESDLKRTTCEQMQAEKTDLISQTLMLDENDERAKIEWILNAELSKLEAVRTELAKKHRAVALLQRQLDDIPSQTELVQFEHRFVELYEHIQARLRETRRYYGTYNALAEANELTLKEISLLNSINSQFEDAMMSTSGRGKLIESMEGIAKGIQQKLGKMQARFQAEQTRCNALKEKYGIALAEQRHYSALLKSFQDECARNERLRMELNGLNVTLS